MRKSFWFGSLLLPLAGCALTVSYDGYERSESADGGIKTGGSSGIGGGTFGGGTFGGGSGGVAGAGGAAGGVVGGSGGTGGGACSDDSNCPNDTACADHYCHESTCQAAFLPIPNCLPATCTGPTESTPSHCNQGNCELAAAEDCGAYACQAGVCLTACASASDCAPGLVCNSGGCLACATCAEKFSNPNTGNPLCPLSETNWLSLVSCCQIECASLCGGGAPYAVCGGELGLPTPSCLTCLADESNCKTSLLACQGDT